MAKPVCKKALILYSFLLILFRLQAQPVIKESLFQDNYIIDPKKERTLNLCIDNLNFLRNNETDGDIFKGYTLPGFRFNPRVVYYPSEKIKLEAGLSLLRYWGADKYPNYAYHDIAEWKADGYQQGVHILPFFRAQIRPISQLNIIIGNIYGGNNHQLAEPLYNPDLNLMADPESGAQILYNSRIASFDVWFNWESFIFKNDTHNEAMALGTSACLHITNPKSALYVGIPVQALFIHRGGEIDAVKENVVTMANGYTGLRFGFNFGKTLKSVEWNILGAAYKTYRLSEPLPFTQGWAFYSALHAQVWNLNLKYALWRSGNYINLFGNPVFGNISTTIKGRTFPRTIVFNPGIKYEQEFGHGFSLGADIDIFYNPKLTAYENHMPGKISQSFTWFAGLYLRINPAITLKN